MHEHLFQALPMPRNISVAASLNCCNGDRRTCTVMVCMWNTKYLFEKQMFLEMSLSSVMLKFELMLTMDSLWALWQGCNFTKKS